MLELAAEHVTVLFSSFGERGRSAEVITGEACEAAKAWLKAGVPVDEHVTDQLLLPLALAGGGSLRTVKPSLHAITNAQIIERFLGVRTCFEQESQNVWRVDVAVK